MSYKEWNKILFNHFFNEDHFGKPVILYIDKNLINDVGKKLGGLSNFLESITIHNGKPVHIVKVVQYLHDLDSLHESDDNYIPVYFNIICLTILAWTIDDSLNAANYYERLNNLLKEGYGSIDNSDGHIRLDMMLSVGQGLSQPKDFKFRSQIESSFRRLEIYTREIRDREIGFYEFRRTGSKYVDIPKAQALINAKDRKSLERFFFERVIPPGTELTTDEAYSILKSGGLNQLTNATKSRWRKDKKNKRIMSEIVCSLVEHWDGEYEEENTPLDGFLSNSNKMSGAYLWPVLQSDLLGTSYTFKLRIHFLNQDFPVDRPVAFKVGNTELTANRQFDGWSNPIEISPNDLQFLFSSRGNKNVESKNLYRILFLSKSIYIFEASFELGGYIPVSEFAEKQDYLILLNCNEERGYIEKHGSLLNEVGMEPNLKGWKIFKVKDNSVLREIKDLWKRTDDNIFELIGGVKIGHGIKKNFSEIVPPKIKLRSKIPGNLSVTCRYGLNKVKLLVRDNEKSNIYQLPESLRKSGSFEIFISDEDSHAKSEYQTINFSLLECILPDFNDFQTLNTGFKKKAEEQLKPTPFLYGNESLTMIFEGENRLATDKPSFLNSSEFENPKIRLNKNLVGLTLTCDSFEVESIDELAGLYELPDLDVGAHEILSQWHGMELKKLSLEILAPPKLSISVSGAERAESSNYEVWFLSDGTEKPEIEITIKALVGPKINVFLNQFKVTSTRKEAIVIQPEVGVLSILTIRWGGINLIKRKYIFLKTPNAAIELVEDSGKKWAGSDIFNPNHTPIFDVYIDRKDFKGIDLDCSLQCFVGDIDLSVEKIVNEIISFKFPEDKTIEGINLPVQVKYGGMRIPIENSPFLSILSKPKPQIKLIGREARKYTYVSNSLPQIELNFFNQSNIYYDGSNLKYGNHLMEKLGENLYQFPLNILWQGETEKNIEIIAYWYKEKIFEKKIKVIQPEASLIEFHGGESITQENNAFLLWNCPNVVKIKNETFIEEVTVRFGQAGESLKVLKDRNGYRFNLDPFERIEGKEYIVELWHGDIKKTSRKFLIVGSNWLKLGFFEGNVDLLKNDTFWVPCWYVEKIGKKGYVLHSVYGCQSPLKTNEKCPCSIIQTESKIVSTPKSQQKKWEKIVYHSKIHLNNDLKNVWKRFGTCKRD